MTFRSIALSVTILFLSTSVNAAVINSLSGGTSHAFSVMNTFTAGPISENGFTWTSTTTSAYGYTGNYSLNSNGLWDSGLGLPYVGLDSLYGDMTFTFDSPVSSVLAFMNYAAPSPIDGVPSMSIYDTNGNLLETHVLSISTPGATDGGEYWGFSQPTADIGSFVLSNSFIVAADLSTATVSAVPVPAASWLFSSGLLGLIGIARRKARS